MLGKELLKPMDEQASPLDEGWWAAVLADEEAFTSSHKENVDKPRGQAESAEIDWQYIQDSYERDEILLLQVRGFNRGGLLVQNDRVQGFVPVSHLVDMPAHIEDEERRQMLAGYLGQSLQLKVIECDPTQERIVFSERAALAGEGCRKQLFHSLRKGETVCGKVTNVTDFGAFVDLGGVEGLIHVSELSWGRVQHPSAILTVGERVDALVLQVSEENARVALSLKRLHENPWEELVRDYQPGDVIVATITTVMHYGAFARLSEGIEGLIHISTIEFTTEKKEIESLFFPGQQVKVKILHIDPDRRRLGLGLVPSE